MADRLWRWGRGIWWLSALLLLCLLVVPVGVLLARAFLSQAWQGVPNQALIWSALGLSLATTFVSALLTCLAGLPLAWWLSRPPNLARRIVNVLIELPIVLPPAVAGLALLLTFGRRGALGAWLADLGILIPFTVTAVILAQIFVSAPFFVRSAVVGFRGVPKDLQDAARVDGADEEQVWRWVIIPLAGRALAAGLILAWARALGEFGATILFAGSLSGRTQTMPLLVYAIFERDIEAAIWAGVLLLGLAAVALGMVQALRRD